MPVIDVALLHLRICMRDLEPIVVEVFLLLSDNSVDRSAVAIVGHDAPVSYLTTRL